MICRPSIHSSADAIAYTVQCFQESVGCLGINQHRILLHYLAGWAQSFSTSNLVSLLWDRNLKNSGGLVTLVIRGLKVFFFSFIKMKKTRHLAVFYSNTQQLNIFCPKSILFACAHATLLYIQFLGRRVPSYFFLKSVFDITIAWQTSLPYPHKTSLQGLSYHSNSRQNDTCLPSLTHQQGLALPTFFASHHGLLKQSSSTPTPALSRKKH